MTKEQQIVMILGRYASMYSNSKPDAIGLAGMATNLTDLPLPAIEAAMKKLLRRCRFFPTVAEIVPEAESIMEQVAEENGTPHTPTAAEAWGEVQRLAKSIGTWGRWEYSHPFVRAAAERFGVYELCTLPMDGVNTARAQFMRMYDSISSQGRERAANKAVLTQLGRPKLMELYRSLGLKLALPE